MSNDGLVYIGGGQMGYSGGKRIDVGCELSEPKADLDRVVMLHSYQSGEGCLVCSKCGTAKHKNKFDGFKFWFAGVGYAVEPLCRAAKAYRR